MNKPTFLAITIVIAALSACSKSQPPSESSVRQKRGPAEATDMLTGERVNWNDIETITNGTRAAWRVAINHDEQGSLSNKEWQQARQKDESEAMQQLQELARRFPGSSSISLMMGQVKEHHGHKKDAIAYYEESVSKNTRNPIYLIKLAEARRKAGDIEQAIRLYRQLVKESPDFSSAKIGLARCLKQQDPGSTEARQLVSNVLTANPYDSEGLAMQKELQSSR